MALPTVSGVVQAAVDDGRIVGAVVFVARGGREVHRQATGLADRSTRAAMSDQAVFRLASVTKPVIAATTMALVERGVLDLTSPITTWLPGFRPTLPDGSSPDITVDHLLTHSSGLTYRMGEPVGNDYDAAGVSDGLDTTDLTLAENLRRIAATRLRFVPGSAFRYSVAYDVLGGLIEQATRSDLATVVDELICQSLGMTQFAFHVPESERNRVPTVYRDGGQPITEQPIPSDSGVVRCSPERIFDPQQWPSGGAGAAATVDDLARFFTAIAADGRPILRRSTMAAMLRGRVERTLDSGQRDWFARGWAVVSEDTAPDYGLPVDAVHWGGAYGHSWSVDPTTRTVIVALTNTSPEGTSGAFPAQVARAVYADLATGEPD